MENILNNPLAIIFIILAILVLVLAILVIMMWLKLRRFLVGIDSDHIGNSLDTLKNEVGVFKDFRNEIESYLSSVEKRLRTSIRSVKTVRFNPWHGSGDGGNQSFATAFMNEEGDGVLISTLFSRDHVSVFGKPLKKHASEHELSGEEKQAIVEAKEGLKQNSTK